MFIIVGSNLANCGNQSNIPAFTLNSSRALVFLVAGLSTMKLYADDTQVNLKEVSSEWDTMGNFCHGTHTGLHTLRASPEFIKTFGVALFAYSA